KVARASAGYRARDARIPPDQTRWIPRPRALPACRAPRAALRGRRGRGPDRDQPRRCAALGSRERRPVVEDEPHRARSVHGIDAFQCRSAAFRRALFRRARCELARSELEPHLEDDADARHSLRSGTRFYKAGFVLLRPHERALDTDLDGTLSELRGVAI